MNSVWGQDKPCPNDCCPRPGLLRGAFCYRRRQWVCPLCCYGWVCQTARNDTGELLGQWVRTARPVPFHRPGRKELRP